MTHVPRRTAVAVGLAAVVVYVIARLALVWRFPPHTDESLFSYWAMIGHDDPAQRFLPLSLGQNPMQEWLGMGLIQLGIEPLTSLRLLSLVGGLVTMGAVAWFARALVGDAAALLAAIVWAVLPFSLVYGVVGVADPLIASLAAVAMVLQYSLARNPRLDVAVVLGIVFGIGMLTKLTMMSAVWLVPLGALLFDWSRDGLGRRLGRWIGALALAGLVAVSMYQVLRLSALWPGLAAAREHALARHGLGVFLDHPGYWIERNWTQYRLAFKGYLTIPVILAATVGLAITLRRTPRVGLYLLGWIALPLGALVALAGEPFLRWLLVVVPPIIVCAGIGAAEVVAAAMRLAGRRTRLDPRIVAVAVVVLLVLPSLAWGARTVAHPATREYPSRDDIDLLQAYSAGGPWAAVVDELRDVPGPVTVATVGNGLEYLFIALRDRPVRFVPTIGGDTRDATIGLRNTTDRLPNGPGSMAWRPFRRLERPRNGLTVTLERRGVVVRGRFASTPEQLERLLGGEEAVNALVRNEPDVGVWIRAWHRAFDSR